MTVQSFETHPDQYVHWRLTVDGAVATLTMDIQEDDPEGARKVVEEEMPAAGVCADARAREVLTLDAHERKYMRVAMRRRFRQQGPLSQAAAERVLSGDAP